MSIRQMLGFRYLISVEGHDKDTGLNWKLNSGSVVMMARPTATSWLMERLLIPGYHYVLLDDDFNNLEERIGWCEAHQAEAKQIAENARAFMGQFADKRTELLIESEVIRQYFHRTHASLPPENLT